MKISSILISFSIFLALPKCCWFNRGVISDLDDESFEMLIAGGYQADYAVLGRHVVSIRTIDKIRYNGDNHFCTGMVISRRAILTAAHCLTDKYKSVMNPRGVLVVFGSSRRLDNFSNDESRRCDRIIIHPNYKRYMTNDLAIILLTELIPHNLGNVRPIQRRTFMNITEGLRCITMGWGQLDMSTVKCL
ncbi:chymotrypsin-like protease CTRL-1 isoform X3 [Drosophila willistoni]|uniref:chymotrypsin-like protease CTRL-1 isoform X3 n=1 Tax=Drosophila willistoni TaxID=7260 RepID=UPI001F07C17F|nr:chymotrypsin-like protease CTRL-1 isoform X3 [Drosophila willistoni]